MRLRVQGGSAGIRQGRLYVEAGYEYDGSLWVRREDGSPHLTLRVVSSQGKPIASTPLALNGSDWQEIRFSFTSAVRGGRLDDYANRDLPSRNAVHGSQRLRPER